MTLINISSISHEEKQYLIYLWVMRVCQVFCLSGALFTPQGASCNLCIIFSFFSLLLFSSLFRFVECIDCGRKFHEICVYYCYLIWPGGWVKLKVFITSIICIKLLLCIKTGFVFVFLYILIAFLILMCY